MRQICLAILWLCAASPLNADDAIQEVSGRTSAAERLDAADQAALEAAVQRLASPSFELRRAAFLQIWQAGQPALPILLAAVSSDDQSPAKQSVENRQLAESVGTLRILIELGIEHGQDNHSLELVDLLSDVNTKKVIQICKLEYWDLAVQLVRNNPQLNEALSDDYGRFALNQIVDAAFEQQALEKAWPIVFETTPLEQSSWIANKLQLKFPDLAEPLPDVEAVRLFYEGRVDDALQSEISRGRLMPMLTRSFRWRELSKEENQLALLGTRAGIAQAAARAVLTEMSGDPGTAEEMWTEILIPPANDEIAPDNSADPQIQSALKVLKTLGEIPNARAQFNQFLLALLLSGRVEPVEEYLIESNNKFAAYEFMSARSEFGRGFELLGLSADLSNFDDWLLSQRQEITNGNSKDIDLIARTASNLVGLGHLERAEQLLQLLAEVARKNPKLEVALWSESIVRRLGRHESRQLCLRVASEHYERMSDECQARVLAGLFPDLGSVAPQLFISAPASIPNHGSDSNWEKLERLSLWDGDYFGPNARTMISGWLRAAKQRLSREQLSADQLSKLANVARDFGYDDVALELLSTDLRDFRGSQALNLHWLDAAEIYLQQLKPQEALTLLASLREYGYNLQAAYVSEVEALLMAGDYDRAALLDRSRWLRALARGRFYGTSYADVTRHFSEREEFARAREYAEPAFMLADPGSRFVYWAASDYSDLLEEEGDYLASADVQRAALLEALQPYSSLVPFMMAGGYVSSLRYSAQQERLTRAIAEVKQENFEEARRHLAISQRLQPQDIEAVVQCYPLLIKARQTEFAESLFAQYEQALVKQIETWPQDGTALNNLAWMYSQCDRKLDEALILAQQAVSLAPSSPVFLDTLAEVEYRLGDVPSAIDSMRGCVKLDPRDTHYRENLVRFSKGVGQDKD